MGHVEINAHGARDGDPTAHVLTVVDAGDEEVGSPRSQLYEAMLHCLGRRAVHGKSRHGQSLYLNVFLVDGATAGKEASSGARLLIPGCYHQNLAQIANGSYGSQQAR